jgi:hypothetical protein
MDVPRPRRSDTLHRTCTPKPPLRGIRGTFSDRGCPGERTACPRYDRVTREDPSEMGMCLAADQSAFGELTVHQSPQLVLREVCKGTFIWGAPWPFTPTPESPYEGQGERGVDSDLLQTMSVVRKRRIPGETGCRKMSGPVEAMYTFHARGSGQVRPRFHPLATFVPGARLRGTNRERHWRASHRGEARAARGRVVRMLRSHIVEGSDAAQQSHDTGRRLRGAWRVSARRILIRDDVGQSIGRARRSERVGEPASRFAMGAWTL